MSVIQNKGKEELAEVLAERAAALRSRLGRRVLIAISGMPGSGKTTAAQLVAERLSAAGVPAMALPMDGYHLTRKQLDAFDDPTEAHFRRGAYWTFDGAAFARKVRELRASCDARPRLTITAPSFDHAVKDPVANGIVISPEIEVVLVEGLYLLLDVEPWKSIYNAFDERWMFDTDASVARERVAHRHVAAGLAPSLALAYDRFDRNDGPNGETVRTQSLPADVTIR